MDFSQIKGSGGLLNKITFTGEDVDFLLKRQRALEVSDNKEPLTSQQNCLLSIAGQSYGERETLCYSCDETKLSKVPKVGDRLQQARMLP